MLDEIDGARYGYPSREAAGVALAPNLPHGATLAGECHCDGSRTRYRGSLKVRRGTVVLDAYRRQTDGIDNRHGQEHIAERAARQAGALTAATK